jgi:hypothetical protein
MTTSNTSDRAARYKAHWAKRQQGKNQGLGVVYRAKPDKVPQYPASARISFRDLRHRKED